jgi:hypothetical protein
MASKMNRTPDRELDKLTRHDAALIYPSTSRPTPAQHSPAIDDLIVSLSSAYENKRARQVVEWERIGSRAVAAGL